MDLAKMAAEIGGLNTNNKKATQALMPTQQKTRSYQDEEPGDYAGLLMSLTRFQFGEERGWWKLKYKINYAISAGNNKNRSLKKIEAYAIDYLASTTDKRDLKYIDLEKFDEYNIIYRFNHIKWFKDNFKTKPKYRPPLTLYWKYHTPLPRIIYVNNYGNDLKKFIQKSFGEWIDKNKKSYLKHSSFSFIEKVASSLFDIKWDYTTQTMYSHLKYSVVLGSLALYMSVYHGKNSNDIKAIQRKVANFGSVKKLDKYIKKLK